MDIAHKILVWLSRLISSAAIIFFLVFVIGEGTVNLLTQGAVIRAEGIALLALLMFAGIATVAAWYQKKLGSVLLCAAGLLLAVFVLIIARRNRALIALLMSGPFILSSALLWLAGKDKRKNRELLIIDKND